MGSVPAPATPVPPASAWDAARDALEHTRRQLFPFHFERWLVLGLLAFLDQCGRGNGSFGARGGSRYHVDDVDTGQVAAWVSSHVALVVAVTAVGLALLVAFMALLLWINTRGVFMYLDAVATGRAEIRRPWTQHAEAAGSLFTWRFALALGTLLAVLLFVAVAAAVVLSTPGNEPRIGLLIGLVLGFLLLILPLVVLAALVSLALRDFVAPLQLHLRCACPVAARALWALVRARPGTFVVYVLLKIVFAVTAALVLFVACCCTCCLAVLPVISQTVFQPVWHFERAWSVCLLRRLGHDLFASFPGHAAPPAESAGT